MNDEWGMMGQDNLVSLRKVRILYLLRISQCS